MKRFLALLLLTWVTLAGDVSAAPPPALPGNSLVNAPSMNGLRANLAASILANEQKLGSPDSSILSANVVQAPKAENLLIATWKEAWVVQRKGQQVTYQVSFEGRGPARGITYQLSVK